MRKYFFLILIIIFTINYTYSQIEGESINYSFEIYKSPPEPPEFNITNFEFVDNNGNSVIDANEESELKFTLSNTGLGDGNNLIAHFSSTGSSQGINFLTTKEIGNLPAGEKIEISHNFSSTMNTIDGKIIFSLYIEDEKENKSKNYTLSVETKAFESPMLEVIEYALTSSTSDKLTKKTPFDVQIIVQNTDKGDAQEVTINLELPANVLCLSGNETLNYSFLNSGEYQSIIYSLIVNDLYSSTEIPIKIKLSEKEGKYSKDKTITLSLNEEMQNEKITEIEGVEESNTTAIADVDSDIPVIGKEYENRFALIIGNENYSTYQTGLNSTSDVAFAINDADVFEDYAVKTLGIPADNIISLRDAQRFQMVGAIERFVRLSEIKEGEAELFVYYAGHGFPDDNTLDAYLMPVDVPGSDVTFGIRLADFYQDLTTHPAKRITVFLDACFSGGGRNEGLVAARSGVKIKVNENTLSGNLIVFAASDSEQISQPYSEKQHGMFTYYLLKSLKSKSGDITYGELADDIIDGVQPKSILINGQEQNPKVIISTEITDIWEDWKLNE